jgi:hypothetical protein
MDIRFIATMAGGMVSSFFYHLLSEKLAIPQNLMSYLTFPEDGKTHTPMGQSFPALATCPRRSLSWVNLSTMT